MMPMIQDQKTIRYISERRCASGGYCFYRLDEPNAADTLYALASLALLDAVPDDPVTLSYLHTFQRTDGSFSNVNVGYAVCRALVLSGGRPHIDPAGWILSLLLPPGDSTRPVESSSLFEHVYLLTDLCKLLGIAIPSDKKTAVIGAVLRYKHPDTGFGHPHSTIIETGHALAILAALGYPVSSAGSILFLKKCEDPAYGFLAVPEVTPAYLEHIHSGIRACSVLGYLSPVHDQCREFIRYCQLDNGGYARSIFGGAATLENTYLALTALAMIKQMSNDAPHRRSAGTALRCCD
ncbi:MAG: prenyltransferase/squalene oxidase repeat-containing protein [Methanoregula sp.]|uniref:prenyltransferase/squalene oxidase repeat-containing protein n=2 Tax=Methanoregula sp. TaxID=2052170 RepID=UPI003BAE6623